MSLATALKDAVAYARPLQNPHFRRLWGTQRRFTTLHSGSDAPE